MGQVIRKLNLMDVTVMSVNEEQLYCIIDIPTDRFGLYNLLRYQWLNDDNHFKREITTCL